MGLYLCIFRKQKNNFKQSRDRPTVEPIVKRNMNLEYSTRGVLLLLATIEHLYSCPPHSQRKCYEIDILI